MELRLCVTTVGKQLQLLVATISCRRFSCTLTTSAPSPSSSSDSCWTPSPVCAALALTPCAAPPCRARNISTYSRLASPQQHSIPRLLYLMGRAAVPTIAPLELPVAVSAECVVV